MSDVIASSLWRYSYDTFELEASAAFQSKPTKDGGVTEKWLDVVEGCAGQYLYMYLCVCVHVMQRKKGKGVNKCIHRTKHTQDEGSARCS